MRADLTSMSMRPVVRARRLRQVVPALALAVLVLALQACREDEQNRPLVYDKGTYGGPADEKLEQDQIEALRQRTAGQRM
jgi:hypothetical protein